LVFDEVHKYARWRKIKGIYDVEKSERRIAVTGSVRLDYYRKGGDSLANRYRYFRLHPPSLGELGFEAKALDRLLKFGGSLEPYFERDETEHRLWHAAPSQRFSILPNAPAFQGSSKSIWVTRTSSGARSRSCRFACCVRS
jgi:hypothetical protein